MVIGFCFLTYDNVLKNDIWNEYFEKADTNKYKIFVHPKYANFIKNQPIFYNNIISKHCNTSWGSFSLITAQKLLLEEGLKNINITHFVFVSHNSIPIQSFNTFYNYLKRIPDSIFEFCKSSNNDHIIRYDKLINPKFSKNDFLFQSQWSILIREDALIVTMYHSEIEKIFKNSYVPDEHAYINYLTYYKNKNIYNEHTTKVVWYNCTPYIFDKISNKEIEEFRNNNNFFLRKIHENTLVDIKFLLSNSSKLKLTSTRIK